MPICQSGKSILCEQIATTGTEIHTPDADAQRGQHRPEHKLSSISDTSQVCRKMCLPRCIHLQQPGQIRKPKRHQKEPRWPGCFYNSIRLKTNIIEDKHLLLFQNSIRNRLVASTARCNRSEYAYKHLHSWWRCLSITGIVERTREILLEYLL